MTTTQSHPNKTTLLEVGNVLRTFEKAIQRSIAKNPNREAARAVKTAVDAAFQEFRDESIDEYSIGELIELSETHEAISN